MAPGTRSKNKATLNTASKCSCPYSQLKTLAHVDRKETGATCSCLFAPKFCLQQNSQCLSHHAIRARHNRLLPHRPVAYTCKDRVNPPDGPVQVMPPHTCRLGSHRRPEATYCAVLVGYHQVTCLLDRLPDRLAIIPR